MNYDADVIVVGAGNAAFSAALSASETQSSVIMLERAPENEAGGNTRFTAGAIRFAYNGVKDLKALVPDLTTEEIKNTDFGSYTEEAFFDDMGRLTEYRTDPNLCEILVKESKNTLMWMQKLGIRFTPIYGRQAFKVDGKFKFWGGLTLEAWGGGPGLLAAWLKTAQKNKIEIRYKARAISLLYDDYGVHGVKVNQNGTTIELKARAIVLASGGFQANTEWRARYLGPGWDTAKVRGTRFNTGDGIRMALEANASPYGNWSGCHAVGWERNAPEFGDLAVGDNFQKHSYPFGIMINANGERFVDEGADFRNYTYAKYGRIILAQPGQFAWQIFDNKVLHLLRDEYRIKQVTKISANTIENLVKKLDDVNSVIALKTINNYNNATNKNTHFNPNIKDNLRTEGLDIPKSNWANTINEPPFEAYAITCGITFTFGGLRITPKGQVLDSELQVIKGLFACGELIGGLFYNNYPGGSGLTAGAVFGKIAGASASNLN
jgi:tricarballylate dehydrogenase